MLLCEPAKTPLRGVVDLIEQLGAETLAHISIAGDDGMLSVIARMPPAATWKEGNAVSLDMRPSQISLFDIHGLRIDE